MSYILDALKKSDEERQTHQGPTIQTIQRQTNGPRSQLRLALIMVVAVCLLIIVSLLFYLWQIKGEIQPPQVTAAETRPTVHPVVPQSVDQAPKTTDNSKDNAPVVNTPTVSFSELPDNIRAEIPPLTFSFHVFSEKVPANRSIIINKRLSKEGDQLEQHLTLVEITQEGVVLQWKDKKFFINVVENW